jgi:hypothetical protein
MSTPDSVVMHDVSALDENLYSLGPTDVAFLLSQTRIETEAAMKSHILDIQAKACKVSLPISPVPARQWSQSSSGSTISMRAVLQFRKVNGADVVSIL